MCIPRIRRIWNKLRPVTSSGFQILVLVVLSGCETVSRSVPGISMFKKILDSNPGTLRKPGSEGEKPPFGNLRGLVEFANLQELRGLIPDISWRLFRDCEDFQEFPDYDFGMATPRSSKEFKSRHFLGATVAEGGDLSSEKNNVSVWMEPGIMGLGLFTSHLKNFYLWSRNSVSGSFNPEKGFFLKTPDIGEYPGFRLKENSSMSLGLGMGLRENVLLNLEYSWYDFSLVDDVIETLMDRSEEKNSIGTSISMRF